MDKLIEGYRHSKLGLIPADWEVKGLGDLFEFKNGVNAGKESYGTGVKFINVMEVIYNEAIHYEIIKGSVQVTKEQEKLYHVTEGDVLFNRTSETTNEVGLASVYFGKGLAIFGGFVIRGKSINNELDNNFKKYCFRSEIVRNQIIKGGQGVVRSNIGQGDLSKVLMMIPPISEQQSIAALLGVMDENINKTAQLILSKERQKTALMQQLLTGKKRLKGFNNKVEFHVLGQYIKEISQRNRNQLTPRVLSVTNTKGFINQSEHFDRVVASEDLSNYKIIKRNQFAYNPSRVNVGSLDLLRVFDSGILSPMYVVFEADTKRLIPEFLYYNLKSNWFYGHIPMFVQGSVRDTLSFDGLCGMKFFIPSIQEQAAIAEILRTVDKEIQLLKEKADRLKEQKKGVMQLLLTGKKRLKIKLI
jgi:type I restriction enzyme, S subunit